MQHTLHELIKELKIDKVAVADTDLAGITADSRNVSPGWVFVAEKGTVADGHDFINKAIDAGAVAVVCEHVPEDIPADCATAILTVKDTAETLGNLASWWYGYPSHQLTLVGVTGTNGKTTTATLLYEMANLMGEKAGLLSTVVNKIDNRDVPSTHTTPDPLTINRLMREMLDSGCTFCAMEVSSHACAQRRIAGLQFDGGIFTNITRDHLDYHRTFDNYLKAKKSFFDKLPKKAFALTNADDRNGAVMLQNTKAAKYTYSIRKDADFKGKIIENRLDGTLMEIDSKEVETNFVGKFNASNLMAVYGASVLVGWDKEDVLKAISSLFPVAGRMEVIKSDDGKIAVVDYAHTPDALANVLSTIKEVSGVGNIITVAGAGGDRDKGKRPLMAAEAVKYSDKVVLTSDNPRTENAADIISDMLAGVEESQSQKVTVIIDRREAIRNALSIAKSGDVVLIAGKGHENYQIIGHEKHHFDDREEVRDYFNNNETNND